MAQFAGLNTQVLGISIDHVPCLQAWSESLGKIDYPLLSDFWPHGAVAVKYGVMRTDGRSERAIFLIEKDGVIRYIDIHDIDEQPDNDVLRAEIRKMDPESAANESTLSRELATMELPSSGNVLYCTRWCPDCRRARAWFESHNLPFTEVDVNAVPSAAAKVRSWADGKLITPTFDIDGTIIIDYDLDRLAEVLKIS